MRTPPFRTLRAFEAAARHRSFKDAAAELHITPSAISHRIKNLESLLGVNLFHRTSRGLLLTPLGEEYLALLQDAFAKLEKATRFVATRGTADVLTVHSVPTFASLWLMPRLASFIQQNPGLNVRVSASPTPANFMGDDIDVDIRYGVPNWKGVETHPLIEETISPLCSPRFLEQDNPLRDPEDLSRVTLIHSEVALVQWRDWVAENNLSGIDTDRGLWFDRTQMTIQAAVEGLGVALDSETMAASQLAAGKLVKLFDGCTKSLKVRAHFMVFPHSHGRLAKVRKFQEWLLPEIENA